MIISIASGKGGTGKTTLALLLAAAGATVKTFQYLAKSPTVTPSATLFNPEKQY